MKKRLHNIKDLHTEESNAIRRKHREGIDRARMNSASGAIAAKIRRRLRVLCMTNAEFANEMGTYASNVSKWLSGTHNFELKTLVDIEDILDISIIDRNVIPGTTSSIITIEDNEQSRVREKYNVNVTIQILYTSADSARQEYHDYNDNSVVQDIICDYGKVC